ncbi:MAG: DNA-protecting protein DprA [Chlorobiales bacterium]|nr:DNA-protecting protein DprA [Chlorobiales bacterium]
MEHSPTSAEFKLSLLILSQIPGVGSLRLRGLLNSFKCYERILSASHQELTAVPGIGASVGEKIIAFSKSAAKLEEAQTTALRQLDQLEKLGARLLTLWDEDYPALLREIYDPPVTLFVRGNILPQDKEAIAIVGTRQATDYGKNATRKICRELAEKGMTIVSGLAYGIDITAHTTAIESGSRTIAVLGCGVDKIYTDPGGKLYPKIIEQGAILSEEWFGAEPSPEKFPRRNRIISGLSLGTVIVESDSKGGALITAAYALDQNREVFAVPGSIFSRKCNGTNELIRDGKAKLIFGAEDILNEVKLPLDKQNALHTHAPQRELPELCEAETLVLKALSDNPVHIDTIAETTGLDISELLILLFELEMKHLVEQHPGKLFKRTVDIPLSK